MIRAVALFLFEHELPGKSPLEVTVRCFKKRLFFYYFRARESIIF